MRVGKVVTPKKVVHYVVFITMVWISYRFYVSYKKAEEEDRQRAFRPPDIGRGRHSDLREGDEGDKIDNDGPADLDVRLRQIHKGKDHQKRRKSQHRRKQENVRYMDDEGEEVKINDRHRGRYDDDEGENVKSNDRHRGRHVDDEGENVKSNDRHRGRHVDDEDEDEEFNDRHRDKDLHEKKGARKIPQEEEIDEDERIHKKKARRERGKRKDEDESDDDGRLGYKEEEKDVPDSEDDRRPKKKEEDQEEFQIEEKVDWELERELQKRRKKYMESVARRAEEYNPEDFKNMQEVDDHLAFITAATDRTMRGLLQFVHSIQYFYHQSEIGIFDLGLSKENVQKLERLCRVSVLPTYINFWPAHLTNLTRNLWRPMIWQMGLSRYGHMVYVEPERFLHAKNMRHYIEHSRRYGITVVGRKLQYSPFVVTHPEMYYFFSVDIRKLQRVNMFDLTMIIMHNGQPVRHEFIRHLISCALEEYCISPPGARYQCDHRLYPGSKKYANCHRYDMSAVNILLDKWFQFKQEEFLVRDIATKHYDGRDVTAKLKFCDDAKKEEI